MRNDSRISLSNQNGNDFGNSNIEDNKSVRREFGEEMMNDSIARFRRVTFSPGAGIEVKIAHL